MSLQGALYRAAMAVWMVLVFGAWIYVDLGYTEPFLSFSDVPGGSMGAFVGAMGVTVAGWVLISSVQQRREGVAWQEAGRRAGLRPADDSGSTSAPALTGTVNGRTITARYDKRKMGGAEGGTWVTFTSGEAELAGPADEGVVVGTAGGRVDAGIGTLDFDEMADTASAAEGLVAVERGDLILVGTSTEAVEAVSSGLSGDALRAIRDLSVVSIGDASGVVARWAEARNEEMEGRGSSLAEYPVDNLVERVPGDATTVTVETKSSIRDGEVLRRFAEGVVAIADAFEEATARPPSSG